MLLRIIDQRFLQASQPKKMKMETRRYTQGELIALALDTEEGNIVEHRDYLKNEAEKRKRARVVRTTIEGPLLRWISKKEEIKVAVSPPPAPPVFNYPSTLSLYRDAYGTSGHLFSPMAYSYATGVTHYAMNAVPQPRPAGTPSTSQQPLMTTTQFHAYQRYMDPTYSAFPIWPPPPSQQQPSYYQMPASTSTTPTSLATATTTPVPSGAPGTIQQPQQLTSEPETRLETVTKNYVVHELAQHKNTPKPSWTDTMESMFGNHVKWDEVKVFVGKNRPLCE